MVKRQALEKLFSHFFITEKKNFSHYSITEHNIYGTKLFICATSNDFWSSHVACDLNVCLCYATSSSDVGKKFKFRMTKSGCVHAATQHKEKILCLGKVRNFQTFLFISIQFPHLRRTKEWGV